MNTKKLLENISENCLSQLTKYKYNKGLDNTLVLKDGDYQKGINEVLSEIKSQLNEEK